MSGLSLSDTAQLAQLAMQLDPNPLRLAGRALGLDPVEQRQIPKWGWYGLGVAGVIAVGILARGYFLRRESGSE